jgi:HlyD family secretion protein
MITILEAESPIKSDGASEGPNGRASRPRARRWRLAAVAVVALLVAATFGVRWAESRFAAHDGVETSPVNKGRLVVTLAAEGNIESANNRELKCQVAGGARIIWIIPDGTAVEAGADLVHLDQSNFEQQLNAQKIVYERAVATKIQAEQDFGAAQADVREYLEGSYRKDLQAAKEQVTIARQNLGTNRNTLSHTERMYRKGFVTALQLEADKFAVERGQLDLQAALTAQKVLEEFTRPKTVKSLEAVRDAADARRRAEQASVNLEKAKLERIQQQLKFCVIKAPQRGMVVYGNDPDQNRGFGGMDNPQIEEGSMIRERQTIVRLPDLSNMQVKTTVHESRVPHIANGMAARVKVLDRTWNGRIKSIANRPLPPQRYATPTKNYACYVSIDGDTTGLKPGMTAQVEILLADLKDVCTVPVASVVEQAGQYYAWVNGPAGPNKREVSIGTTDERVIEIKTGLAAGENVIVNPRATVPEAMRIGDIERQLKEDDSRFRPRHVKSESPSKPEEKSVASHTGS